MTQVYHVGPQMLETGTHHVSAHLRWLIRNMVIDYCGIDPVDVICYRICTPDNRFARAHSGSKAIVMNLMHHFDTIVPTLEEGDNKYTSLKFMLLKELLNSAAHEAHHLKVSEETGNWDNSDLEEEQAKYHGDYLAWRVAKKYDVEIDNFGPILDDAIDEFIEGLRGILKEEEENNKKATEWMALQVYMHENKLAYYNPNLEESLNFRKGFETGAEDEDPWIDEVKTFIMEVSPNIAGTEQNIAQPSEAQPAPMAPPASPIQPTSQPAAFTPPANPMTPPPVATTQPNMAAPTSAPMTAPVGIGTLNDGLYDAPGYEDYGMPPAATPAATGGYNGYAQQPAAPAVQHTGAMLTVETVLRRLFHHVQTKCEFNTDGGYNNPHAVLEPVNISDIPGAQELFVAMDTMDAAGQYVSQQQCNGQIRGLVSKDNRPRYTLYLNMNGQLHKRTFITNDPNKEDQKNPGNLGKWAQANRMGTRIMMLLQDNIGIRADIQLEAGKHLGQETFKVWEVKNAGGQGAYQG